MRDVQKLLDAREVATRVGVKPQTILTWARRGWIPSVRAGQHPVLFEISAVLTALKDRGRAGR